MYIFDFIGNRILCIISKINDVLYIYIYRYIHKNYFLIKSLYFNSLYACAHRKGVFLSHSDSLILHLDNAMCSLPSPPPPPPNGEIKLAFPYKIRIFMTRNDNLKIKCKVRYLKIEYNRKSNK